MLTNGRVATRLPAQDLERARAFYSEKLGLEAAEEREGGLRYVGPGGEFAPFQSAGSAAGDHTQMMWEVDDIEATVRELRSRGVVFEDYDLPGLKTVDGIAEIEGQYPSKGSGERGAWFRDSEATCSGSANWSLEQIRGANIRRPRDRAAPEHHAPDDSEDDRIGCHAKQSETERSHMTQTTVRYFVTDVDEAIDFYCNRLGFHVDLPLAP
jgi:catechol 2,3-dioxygenase-like lactoylglutathione lyase family enzyme